MLTLIRWFSSESLLGGNIGGFLRDMILEDAASMMKSNKSVNPLTDCDYTLGRTDYADLANLRAFCNSAGTLLMLLFVAGILRSGCDNGLVIAL